MTDHLLAGVAEQLQTALIHIYEAPTLQGADGNRRWIGLKRLKKPLLGEFERLFSMFTFGDFLLQLLIAFFECISSRSPVSAIAAHCVPITPSGLQTGKDHRSGWRTDDSRCGAGVPCETRPAINVTDIQNNRREDGLNRPKAIRHRAPQQNCRDDNHKVRNSNAGGHGAPLIGEVVTQQHPQWQADRQARRAHHSAV